MYTDQRHRAERVARAEHHAWGPEDCTPIVIMLATTITLSIMTTIIRVIVIVMIIVIAI